MKKSEHLTILDKGVEYWNQWRKTNLQITPLIYPAYFEGLNLTGVNFKDALFDNAIFIGATLKNADLSNAMLTRINFSGADLRYANLSHADLTGVNLSDANLNGASFEKTMFGGTILGNTNLTNAKNLDKCYHAGPSTIDYRTFQISGSLPVKFLRACGLSDELINYYLSLLDKPIQFHSCFISYANNDNEFAEKLHTDLQDNSIRCWFALENMKIGDRIRFAIDDAIKIHDKLLLVLSKSSIISQWVEHEVEKAFEREQKEKCLILFPIRIDDAIFDTQAGWASYLKNTRNIGDFSKWKDHNSYEKAFNRLKRDLKVKYEKP